ncbi:MAG TPA: ribosome recycling factor, partial [Nitrospiria bacterium]|nr:ribosome recycling factor [Nitrospiria bacterium]
SIRTGRASPAFLDNIKVNFYGTPTPIKQVGTLSIPDSRTLLISPWDTSQIVEIEKALLASDLGITPSNDGKVVRLSFPPLTEERRKDLVKHVKKIGEESKVQIRNARRDINDELKKQQKDGKLSEDELRKNQDEVQKQIDQSIAKLDELIVKKEQEILEV